VNSLIQVTGLPGVDITERRQALMEPGDTLLEFARKILPGVPDECFLADGRAFYGDWVVPGCLWNEFRPPAGSSLVIRLTPGDSPIFRTGLQIAVLVAAAAATAYLGPIAGPLLAGLAGASITVIGNLLINQFIPVRDSKPKGRDESYTIENWRNPFAPNAPFTMIFGQIRCALPHIAKPFSEAVGDNQFATAALGAFGPLDVADFKIGDTPLERFAGVGAPPDGELLDDYTSDYLSVEVRRGYDTDTPLTLYPTQVVEVAQSVDLGFTALSGQTDNKAGDEVTRVTPRDITSYSLDFTFPQGLIVQKAAGEDETCAVAVLIEERLLGESLPWTTVFADSFHGKSNSPITRTFARTVPVRGTYELRVTKVGATTGDGHEAHQIIWSCIRGFRPEYPLNFSKPLFLVAIKIRASGQLNGTVDELNCVLTSICPDWDAGTGTWITRATRNPASLFRYALQCPAKLRPVSDDQINLEQLQDWHDFCVLHNLTYDRVHDFESSPFETLSDIASAGRATPQRIAGQWGVVIDTPRTKITAPITSENSWGYEEEIPQARLPDALRVTFRDRTNKWQRGERIVPFPGFVGDPQIIRGVEPPGITDPEVAYREGLRIAYGLQLRKRTITVNQDFQSLINIRGDLAGVSHDVLSNFQVDGRVRSVSTDGKIIHLDRKVTLTAGELYGVRFHHIPTDDEVDDGSALTPIWNVGRVPGSGSRETNRLFIQPSSVGILGPVEGDRFFFGPRTQVVEELLVNKIQRGSKNSARLVLVDHAPEIEALVDAAIVPPWDGRVGDDGPGPAAPAVPVIASIVSGQRVPDGDVLVSLQQGSGGGAVSSYDVQHRLFGTVPWTTVSVPAASGAVAFGGYTYDDVIEVQARAIGMTGLQSAYCAIETHIYGEDDLLPPSNVTAEYVFDTVGGNIAARILASWDAGTAGDYYVVQYSLQSGGSQSEVSTPVDATTATTGVVSDTESYRVRVQTVRTGDLSGFSDWSDWFNVPDVTLLLADATTYLRVDADTLERA
jgi:hypothetical protein